MTDNQTNSIESTLEYSAAMALREGNMATVAGVRDELVEFHERSKADAIERFRQCMEIVAHVQRLKCARLNRSEIEDIARELAMTPYSCRQLVAMGDQLAKMPTAHARPLAMENWIAAAAAPSYSQSDVARIRREAYYEGVRNERVKQQPTTMPADLLEMTRNWKLRVQLELDVAALERELMLANSDLLNAERHSAAEYAKRRELEAKLMTNRTAIAA